MWGKSLPLTVTEICIITVTTILAYRVSTRVSEFERAVARISIGQSNTEPELAPMGQAELYREVRRARHHERPLALMAVGIEKESIQVALDRMVQEVQQTMMKQYVLSRVARTLCEKLEDYDIVAQRNDHFLVLLPEVTPDQLTNLVDQLRQAVSEETGVTLQVGTASLPKDAVTFESLVKRAVREMNGKESKDSIAYQLFTAAHERT
jgi:GGDEF domain-containing protein